MGSVNGTYVNGTKLTPEDKVTLRDGSIFMLHNEIFVLYAGTTAARLIDDGGGYYLINENSKGIKLLSDNPLFLDRGHKWADGTLDDPKISRSGRHAVLTVREANVWLEDKGSTNGTWLNGIDIRPLPTQHVKSGDQIRVGGTVLKVGKITF